MIVSANMPVRQIEGIGDLELELNLAQIATTLKKRCSDFPTDYCTKAAIDIFEKLGLDIEAGYLGTKKHTWNVDHKKDIYADITACQYGGNFPRILLVERVEAIYEWGYIPVPEIREGVLQEIESLKAEKMFSKRILSYVKP